jgi:hypothetical protein
MKSNFISPEGILEGLENAPIKHKWNPEPGTTRSLYLAAQSNDIFKLKVSNLANTTCHSENDIYAFNTTLVDTYVAVADKVMPKKSVGHGKSQNHKKGKHRTKPKNPWFDASCILLKRELKRLAKDHGKFPSNQNISSNYYAKRRLYKKHIRSKKDSYIAELSKDIENGKNINCRADLTNLKGCFLKAINWTFSTWLISVTSFKSYIVQPFSL